MSSQIENKLWTRPFIVLALINTVIFIGFHMLNATFPFYIKELGGDEAIAGLTTGLFSVAAVIVRPIIGWFVDNRGRRVILLVGLIGMAILPISYSFVTALALIIVLRIFHGLLWSCASTAVSTVVSDIIPKSRFGEGMGFFSTGAAAAMAIGPFIGLAALNNWGFRPMFFMSSLAAAIALLLIFKAKYVSSKQTNLRFDLRNGFRSLIDKDALPAAVTMFLFVMPNGAVSTFIALYALQINIANGGVFFSVMAIMTIIVRLLVGKVADKYGEMPIVIAGNISTLIAMVLLACFPGNASFMIAAAFYGLGFGMMPPTMQAMAMRIAPPERRGAAASTFLCSFDLGIGIGGVIAGYLIRYFSYFTMYGLMSVFLIASLIVYWFWARKSPSSFYFKADA